MRNALLLTVSLLALNWPAAAEAPFDFDHTPGKLPKDVVPDAYRIDITPDLEKLTLTGHETIDVQFHKPGNVVVLNQAGLKLTSAKLEDGNEAAITLDEKAQTATLRFAKPVSAARHTLSIAYTGPIPATPNGIYYDDYKTEAGVKKRMLVTQFEVADARRMFPGWDEPAFKATFQLTVTLPKDLAVVSNMPAAATTPVGATSKRVEFQTSPRMSTYLLALVAGDMASLHGQAGGAQMDAWTPTGLQDKARYALDAEQAILPFYNDYFGVPYPLPKLDMIAIPGNYAAGAMENWGAITFIDDAMLFDAKTSSPATREEIYLVVAHEMAHQWSGDLVTMGWWDNIWLNEGFATWMEEKATDHFNPAWQIWPRQHDTREDAMAQDAQPSTHPIQQPIRDESEANSAFDGISYQKGGQIIRMIEDWIGPDVFRDGMRAYMRAHKYGNATSADLWAALGGAAKRDVAHVATAFTEQPGIPLVHVTRSCVDGKAQITLTQDRFTINDPHPARLTWTIPVTVGAPGSATQRVLLTQAPATLPIGDCSAAAKINLGENGYYRSAYDAASFKALADIFPKLEATDRVNLLGDQFALFVAARAPLSEYLDLLPQLKDEANIAVWTDTLNHLRRLHEGLAGSPLRARFDSYASRLVRTALGRLGWDARPDESFLDSLLRPQLIAALGRFDDAETVAEADRRFKAFLKDPNTLAAALRDPVVGIVGHHADQATYDTLKALGMKAPGTEEKLRYFGAMAAAANPDLMRKTVEFLNTGEVPNGRITQIIFEASSNSGNADQLYDMVKPHEAELAARLPADGLGPSVMVAAAAASANPAIARRLLAEKSSVSSTGGRIWAARVADYITTRADLQARALPALTAWLNAHG